MKKLFIVILFCSLLSAQEAGKSGLSFLKLPADAAVAGMAETGLAFSSGPMALYYNASSLDFSTGTSIAFMHNKWIQGINSEVFAAGLQLFGQPIAVGVSSLTVPDIEIRTKPGISEGTFTAHFTTINIGSSFNLAHNMRVGVTVKNIFENIYADDANGWAFDGYFALADIYQHFSVFAGLKNFGSMNKLRTAETVLPSSISLGVGHNPVAVSSEISFRPGLELLAFTGGGSKINFGGEAVFKQLIAIRAGYTFAESIRKFSCGLGIDYDFVSFDYALIPISEGFGSGHLISLQVDF